MVKWDAPYNNTRGPGGSDTVQYEGFIVDLMDRISQVVGFKYKLIPVQDGRYGYRLATGLWDGMIGELVGKVTYREQICQCKNLNSFFFQFSKCHFEPLFICPTSDNLSRGQYFLDRDYKTNCWQNS